MKKTQSTQKTKSAARTVDEYIARIPEPAKSMLTKLRTTICSAAPPSAVEVLSYKMPAFEDKGILVWYAAFSDHCSLFPKASVIAAFKKELTGYSTSKGTIHFPLDKPLPIALIKKLVKARVAEIASKNRS